MKKIRIQGIIPPILTPMLEDESINEQELRRQVNRLISAGVHGIFPLGTNSEAYALDTEEKQRVLEIVVEETDHRVPVYAGTGCITTRETARLSSIAQDLGIDVLSVITPFFASASQEDLYAHYMEVAASVDLPILLCNEPTRTGNTLDPATVERLARSATNIVGINDSSGDFDNVKEYLKCAGRLNREFAVLSGDDSLILPCLMFGGKGGVAGFANVFPYTMVEIYESYIADEFNQALRAQNSIWPFQNLLHYGNPNTIIKISAGLLGQPVGPCRKPFHSLSEEGMEQLKKTLNQIVANGLH